MIFDKIFSSEDSLNNTVEKDVEIFPTANQLQFERKFRTLDEEFKDFYTFEDFDKINSFAAHQLHLILLKEKKLDEKKLIYRKEPDGQYFGQIKDSDEYI